MHFVNKVFINFALDNCKYFGLRDRFITKSLLDRNQKPFRTTNDLFFVQVLAVSQQEALD